MNNSTKPEKAHEQKFFGITLSPTEWTIQETEFGLDEQHIQESLFTLGNGFIGSRGVLEELPERAMPGTFITGVYDKSGAQVEELVNLPNPMNFIIAAEGEKLDMHFMEFLSHARHLDMKKGILVRKTLFKDGKQRRFLYRSLRFFSMSNPHLMQARISLTLLNGKAELTALSILDDSVTNYGGLIYGSRRHVRLMEADTKSDINYYAYRTLTSKIWVAYANTLSVEKSGVKEMLRDRVYDFQLKAGETVTFTKTFSICTSLQYRVNKVKEETLCILRESISKGFERSIKEHTDEWNKRWDHANITIAGDSVCDKALRFNIYHLIIAGYKGNFPMSIGARALTGQGYRGHIFWDAEIFLLPFYLHTDPVIAKHMLLYRYNRIGEARKNAKRRGYRGALFPWESSSRGDDVTPVYAKDTDGSIFKMDTMDYELHISADIAYAVFNYYSATGDIEFMIHNGAEIVFETARFWQSRVVFDKKRKKFGIRDITGPDEFHTRVDNNAYTNTLAAWNMEYAHTLYGELKDKAPKALENLSGKLRIREHEVEKWRHVSHNIYIPKSPAGIMEQFEGYFKKKEALVKSYDNYFMPEAPQHISYDDFNKTKYIKQADVLLLFYLFPGRFTSEEKLKNYHYYIHKTIHQSSLSHSMHAIIASELNNRLRAYAFFLSSAQIDLKNLHNNTDGGMHMASVGGVWQAAVFGFAGVSFEDDHVKVNPRLPGHWKCMEFSIFWKKCFLKFKISNTIVTIKYYPIGSDQEHATLRVFDTAYTLKPFGLLTAKKTKKEQRMKRVKDIMKDENLIFADEDTPVKKVSTLLTKNRKSSVPIVNAHKELCGIVSEQDILKVVESEHFQKLKAKDIMKKDVEYVKDDDHVEIAMRVFTERQYRILPVLRGKELVGVITRKEILSSCLGDIY